MLKKTLLSFPVVFEILIWLFYVGLYKYSYYIDEFALRPDHPGYFPYPIICLYSLCSTLYLVPYYKWAVPQLLYRQKYGWLIVLTLAYFIILTTWNNVAVARLFALFNHDLPVRRFFKMMSAGFFMDWNTILTDAIAFIGIAFAYFSFRSEQQRHQTETDHLRLQLSMLKTQLQPHFLFNTLNSLYGMSLTGAKETPRFILLLSQMMQYILYDCDQEEVSLPEEVDFLLGYFEIEQKKFPQAHINFKVFDKIPDIKIPPLLFLPLVENSFKHGGHKLEAGAVVQAELVITNRLLIFNIENDMLQASALQGNNRRGGIGLTNIKKRLELYYAQKYTLKLHENGRKYIAHLTIDLQ